MANVNIVETIKNDLTVNDAFLASNVKINNAEIRRGFIHDGKDVLLERVFPELSGKTTQKRVQLLYSKRTKANSTPYEVYIGASVLASMSAETCNALRLEMHRDVAYKWATYKDGTQKETCYRFPYLGMAVSFLRAYIGLETDYTLDGILTA